MRILLAMAVFAGSIFFVLNPTADAAARKRSAKSPYYSAQPRYSREQVECERGRHEDPTGKYASYPCWAQEVFGRGQRGGGAIRR
jgi:hypothetical protein